MTFHSGPLYSNPPGLIIPAKHLAEANILDAEATRKSDSQFKESPEGGGGGGGRAIVSWTK